MPYKTFSVLHIYVGLKRVGSSFFPLHQSCSSREAHITIQTKGKMYFFSNPLHTKNRKCGNKNDSAGCWTKLSLLLNTKHTIYDLNNDRMVRSHHWWVLFSSIIQSRGRAATAQRWPFRTHHPEEMPISNIYSRCGILMCLPATCWGEPCNNGTQEAFSVMFAFQSWENLVSTVVRQLSVFSYCIYWRDLLL